MTVKSGASKTGSRVIAAILFAVLGSGDARAMDSTEVLPESINSPSVRMGYVNGIGMKFMSSGDLMTLGDINSIEFDLATLRRFEPRVTELVSVLNQFGSQRLGDQLSLGVLRVETTPEVQYVAPVYAYGITEKWTMAVGLPVLRYRNKLNLKQTGSNLQAIRDQVGTASADLNDAFNQLDVNLATLAQETLVKKGYRPLVDRDEDQIGDLQIVSLVQLNREKKFTSQFKTILTLPTGKPDDPDDLADLGIYGYTAIENQILGNYQFDGKWRVAAKTGFRYTLPDRISQRVPTNESDSLPGLETKETVNRQTGVAIFAGGSVTYGITPELDIAVGIESTRKFSDRYSGSQGRRYDLLETETESSSDRARLGISYSSIESFFANKAWLPTVVAYEYSDTFRGSNVERTAIHEIWLQLFF